jgi:hypothetical protein
MEMMEKKYPTDKGIPDLGSPREQANPTPAYKNVCTGCN